MCGQLQHWRDFTITQKTAALVETGNKPEQQVCLIKG